MSSIVAWNTPKREMAFPKTYIMQAMGFEQFMTFMEWNARQHVTKFCGVILLAQRRANGDRRSNWLKCHLHKFLMHLSCSTTHFFLVHLTSLVVLNMILWKSQEPLMFLSWTTNPGRISSGNCKTVTGVKITSYCVPLTPSHSKDPTCANNWSFNWDFWHSNTPHRNLFTITCRCLHFCTKLISMQWQFKFGLCIIIRYQPVVELLNGIQSPDRSIPISEITDSKLLDARANQTWTAMRHLWPASAAGIPPVWVPESPCFQSTWWPLMTTPACCFPDEVPRKPTQMALTSSRGCQNKYHTLTSSCPSSGLNVSCIKQTLHKLWPHTMKSQNS